MSRARSIAAVVAGAALLGVLGWQLSGAGGADTAAPPAPASPSPTPTAGPLDHEDDYTAPAEELIDHVDHLDFDRLPADTRRELEAMIAEREQVAGSLWSVYGPSLFPQEGSTPPPRFRVLDAYELAYVLMAARAEQVATAASTSGSVEASRPVTGPDHDDVTVAQDGDCVTVAFADDPFARAFGARLGPRGPGPLRQRLEQRVTVGIAGEPACDGAPLAFSPRATAALDD
jgi:hypothetical protein